MLLGSLKLSGADVRARGMVMPIYGNGPRAEAVLRVDTVSTTHQKRRFFRVGLLPAGRLDRVSLELLGIKELSSGLAKATG
ncbi:MAG: hypothetical protein CMO80_24985, partial [Verrucomicrobiales bacterium]|nr:hypothetical protein [Verrucomicrobiales bacterium]